ncbi:MAG: oxygen-dependent coproporphyrinogen oxidase [Pseudomonadota bacterium]
MTIEQQAQVKNFLLKWQNQVCENISEHEADKKFHIEDWRHGAGGGGQTRVLEAGTTIERCGVNFSHVQGKQLPPAATLRRPELEGQPFSAMGVSIIVHPCNPYVPTTHANLRYIETQTNAGKPIFWFGGGFDLTPYYPFAEDCIHWHEMAKQACEPFGTDIYPQFKKQCDEYFYLKHRQEARGIGGLFFDDLNQWGFHDTLAFIKRVGEHFLLAYVPILKKRKQHIFTEKERNFQTYRRGRYVEFNLIYDRGTLFGLQSGGRTESILMSLPPVVNWQYNWQPEPNSPEEKLYEDFLVPRNWV